MRGRIENLGDYNTMRIMLQEKNGDLSALIKDIKLHDAPKQIGLGILMGAPIGILGTVVVNSEDAPC